MSIESMPEINVDNLQGLSEAIGSFSSGEKGDKLLVNVTGSVQSWEKIKDTLCDLRAANLSPVLHIKGGIPLDDDEIIFLFSFMRDWDQLFLHNFLELCGEWVPKEFQSVLMSESKIEMKWISEWLTANSDQRIYKYPSLPWRSFIRKIIGENFNFAVAFLALAAAPATEDNVKAMHEHIKAFLEIKKKVVCVFPKKWGKLQ
ncbi:MAG: hypothetical protein EBR01_01800 [Proteobacteria bacterium]|nr:hypothetical protein [Pseudomonadota bacterium]NBY19876.1 hypothetical protein [bacterium]